MEIGSEQMTEADRSTMGATNALVATATAVASISGHADEAVAVAAFSAALQPFIQEQVYWVFDVMRRFVRRRPFTAQTLEDELSASPAIQELLIRGLDVSRTASAEEKRRAIAASIAAGFESDLAAARENDVLRVIADLDLAHVLALEVLSSPRLLPHKTAFLGPMNFEAQDLGQIDNRLIGLENRLIAVLVSHGLVANETVSTYDNLMSSFRITAFGQMVLERFTSDEDD